MHRDDHHEHFVKGRVLLMKKTNLLDFNHVGASIADGLYELLGKKVSFQLVSAVNIDAASKGKVGKPSYLEDWLKKPTGLAADEDSEFTITFKWDEEIAVPGALIVRNEHHSEFYLKSVTLEDVPNHGRIHFVCNSWVYPAHRYQKDRIFFSNETYFLHETPPPLLKYREEELISLRGNGGVLEEWDRVYDYALYNDLGEPDKGPEYVRPIFGGSTQYPYPRRGRTGRPPNKKDPQVESMQPITRGLDIYVPRDERFGHLRMSDMLSNSVKSVVQFLVGTVDGFFGKTPKEFDSFEEVLQIYGKGVKIPKSSRLEQIRESIPSEFVKSLLRSDGSSFLKFPMPDIIKEDKSAWRTDEEFAREMLAGIHPIAIRRLEEFPPASKLDPEVYGDQNSSITNECITHNLDGLDVNEALKKNRLYILDHHDTVMPILRQVNTDTSSKVYATRTLLFLKDDGTLKPLAIELSLPHPEGDRFGAVSKVYTPAHDGVEGSIWQLAKAYVAVTDCTHHQLISHWLITHAVTEPFVLATHRQLSVLHPIYKLLHPHFRDTMHINALARQTSLNAGGLFEIATFSGKYSVQWTSQLYRDWVFTDQAVPRELVKRGMAIEDPESPHGFKLTIEDYPYAVDALEIWSAMESWVKDYCSFYYKSDDMIINDTELQSWWKEIREIGHGDKKDEKWWPEMKTLDELVQTFTTIIWVASALHAALNFGQYPYAGYFPNRPTISRRFMPEPGTPEFEQLLVDPDRVLLRTIMSQHQALVGISLIELISRHSSDEVYLGQRDTPEWTLDTVPLEAFKRFQNKLKEAEENIVKRNDDERLRNRVGPAIMPYTALYPSSEIGITRKGIPNKTSSKVYASRTLLFLNEDETLKPLAIELSLPHPQGDQFGAISSVYTPASNGIKGSIWQLAKAYVVVNDSGYHQLISHWLNTHAVIEPFVIATHRQLSVLHPIHKLLLSHFRDTMHINAIARQVALNANGLLEVATFPRNYAVQWTSELYKNWVFTDHAVPQDLVKRGMAERDPENPNGYKLVTQDYPYAVDALEIWSAIESWVKDYCSFYYNSDNTVTNDAELQSWWREIKEIGHGDKKDEKWWPEMNNLDDLTLTCTTIIWVASALHAAVNFGQYSYGGYYPNRPTISRRFMPELGTPEYDQLKLDPERIFLRTITSQIQALVGISLIELLSKHSSDEVYLGQRDDPKRTSDSVPLEAFKRFQDKLMEVEENIVKRNDDERLKNRVGQAKLPYTLLYPSSGIGITSRGIPNSIST